MKIREYTGKTTQEAIDAGLRDLGVARKDVNVLVLEEGAKGLFGLFGSKPARVAISMLEDDPIEEDLSIHWSLDEESPKKEKQKDKQKEKRKPESAPAKPSVEHSELAQPAQPAQQPKADEGQEARQSEQPARKPREPREPRPAREPKAEKKERREPRKARRDPMAPAQPFVPSEPPVLFPEDTPAGRAQRFLAEVTTKMGAPVEIYVEKSREDALSLRLIGDTLGILIGHRGETLDALQYLTSLQVNRGHEEYIRVTLDTENYRAKREDSLRRYAVRMANRAEKTGRRVVLEPMNPYERRVIHTALQDHERVETHSEGEEPGRRVVITLRQAGADQDKAQQTQRPDGAPAKRKRNRRRKPRNPANKPQPEGAEQTSPSETVLAPSADENQA